MREDDTTELSPTWTHLIDVEPQQVLRALISAPDMGVAVFDREFRYQAINQTLARMHGIPVQQHFGRTVEDIMGDAAREIESFITRVFQSGRPLWGQQLSATLPTRHELGHWIGNYLPIMDRGGQVRQVGVVVVEVTKQKQLEQSVRTLSNKLEEERRRLATLLEVNQTLVSTLDFKTLFTAISNTIKRVVPHEFAGVSLYNAQRDGMQIWILSAPDHYKFMAPGETVPRDESMAWQAFHHKETKNFTHDDLARMNTPFATQLLQAGIQTVHCVPLRTSKGVLGVLKVGSTRENAFSGTDQQLLEQVAAQVAIALDNARAYREIAELKDRLAEEKLYLEGEIRSEFGFEEIIGDSAALKRVLGQAKVVAGSEATVLILGETGTGKELIARAIHRMSKRHSNSFIKMNCAAIPTGLLESELFGHEKGAFTGAITQKIGRLELADKGTMFLDEVGDIPLELQPKLLRVLQDQEFERLGSTKTIRVSVRLIAATNRDLAKSVAERQFRSDLYYRLRVFPIHMPSLRERRQDIPQLVRYFVQKCARRMNKRIESIPSETMNALINWYWPGNIRELENMIERSVILTQGTVLRLPVSELQPSIEVAGENATLEAAEREHIARILRETGGVISGTHGAAAKLGLKRTTLQSKMQKLGISRQQYRARNL
jgi:formate hydrogenlyase transcriptional activator